MEKECICTKTHFRVTHRSIREEKLKNDGITISNKRVYIKKGSLHTFAQKELYRSRERIVDGLFVYYDYGDSDSYFESFYTTDIKKIRKVKLKKIENADNE